MPSVRTFSITSALLVVGGLIALTMVQRNTLGAERVSGALARMLSPVVTATGVFRGTLSLLVGPDDLLEQNTRLRGFEGQVAGLQAAVEALRRENEFLRSSAGIPQRPEAEPVLAGVFTYIRAGGVRELVINRGSRNWVSRGDIVLDAGNGLVGIISDVGERTSRVRQVTDAAFEVAARVAGSEVAGLAHAHGGQGLVLDLVKKDESVTEGQEVVTSGADGLPAGLRLGVVRSVQDDAATLFRIVRLSPIVPESYTGPVLVVRP
jgi:rod shape-determining protein MreC